MQKVICACDHIGVDTPEQVSPTSAIPALQARGMSLVGISDAGHGYSMRRPRPPYGHVLVTLRGSGMVWVDGRWVECGLGDAYLSPPYATSAFETRASKRWKFAWVFLHPIEQRRRHLLTGERSSVIPADGRLLAAAIEGLYFEGMSTADAGLLNVWANLISVYIDRLLQPVNAEAADPLARLWVEVDIRLSANWSLAKLAAFAGVSSETLRKLCIAHHGQSPIQYVTQLRMRRAASLLESTSAKIAAVARTVGYANAFAFSTTFKRTFDQSPREWRRRTAAQSPASGSEKPFAGRTGERTNG